MEDGVVGLEKGGPSRLNGKALLPGVRSRGVVEKGIFIGADLGMTSGLTGSSPVFVMGEYDLWSSKLDIALSMGLGVSRGEPSFWLPSSSFLLEVDKS